MLRILSLLIAILLTAGAIILIAGYTTPPQYSNSMTVYFDYSIDMVWEEITNLIEMEKRKPDVESLEIVEQFGRQVAWQENLKRGGYRIYRTNEYDRNRRFEIELVDSSYDLTGIWTFELFRAGSLTRLVISEESELKDIRRRGIRKIFGRDRDLLIWIKYIRVGIMHSLIRTP